jgi:hypothetical protein
MPDKAEREAFHREQKKVGWKLPASRRHALLSVDDAEQLTRFIQYVDGNIAREVGALVNWKGPFWTRRYTAIVVSDEESAQVERLRYILAHGVKENLVERVLDWPGVHAARPILEDKPLTGYWFDRTQEYAARNRGEEHGRLTYATEETFVLTRLPCWEHLSTEEYRQRVAALVEEIELDARAARMARQLPVLGVAAILRQRPHTRPNKTKKSPALRFHAARKAIRDGLREAYGFSWLPSGMRRSC